MKKPILALMILVLFASANMASANIFSDVFNKLVPHPQPVVVNTPQPQVKDGFDSLMAELHQINTPDNIQTLNANLKNYGIRAIKVHVTDYSKDFYVVQGHGLLSDYPAYDKEIALSRAQIEQIKGYIQDGKITPYEQFRMWLIYRNL